MFVEAAAATVWPAVGINLHSVLLDLHNQPEVRHWWWLALVLIQSWTLTLRIAAPAIVTYIHIHRWQIKDCIVSGKHHLIKYRKSIRGDFVISNSEESFIHFQEWSRNVKMWTEAKIIVKIWEQKGHWNYPACLSPSSPDWTRNSELDLAVVCPHLDEEDMNKWWGWKVKHWHNNKDKTIFLYWSLSLYFYYYFSRGQLL